MLHKLDEAERLIREKRYPEALHMCNELIESGYELPDVYRARSFLNAMLDNEIQALADIDIVIASGEAKEDDYFDRGVLRVDLNLLHDSIDDFDAVLRLVASIDKLGYKEMALMHKAVVHLKLGNPQEAINACSNISSDFHSFVDGKVWSRYDVLTAARRMI